MTQLSALGRVSPPFSDSPQPNVEKLAPEADAEILRHAVPAVDRSQADPAMVKAAQGMEAMFLDYMMKVMRQTVPKNELDLESPATNIYRSMLDTEIAQKAAENGGIGLADQIIAYLQRERYNLPQGPEHPYRRYK